MPPQKAGFFTSPLRVIFALQLPQKAIHEYFHYFEKTKNGPSRIVKLTFGVSILSSSMKTDSAWQLEEGNENTSAAEVDGRPGDLSSLTLWGRKFPGAIAAWVYKEKMGNKE